MEWIQHEGKMVKSFLHLEDIHANITLNEIWNGSKYVSTSDEVLPVLHDFYSCLYENSDVKNSEQIQNFLDTLSLPKLHDGGESLLGPITSEEVETAIKKLCPGKAPGIDGLTADFYSCFSDSLCDILASVFNNALEVGQLSYTQHLAIIILLYKKGDDHLVENYRPISLTNTDYKILAYILTMHLESYLVDIIYKNQTAYMSKHFIGLNIHAGFH